MQQPTSLVFVCKNLHAPHDPHVIHTRSRSDAALAHSEHTGKNPARAAELRIADRPALARRISCVTALVAASREAAMSHGRVDPTLGETLADSLYPRPDNSLDLSALEATP